MSCSLAKICCSGNVSQFCHHGRGAVTNKLGRGSFVFMGFIRGPIREWRCFLWNLGVWKVLLLLHGELPGPQGFLFCTCCKNSGKIQVRAAGAAGSSVGSQCSSLVGQVSGGVCSSRECWDTGALFSPSWEYSRIKVCVYSCFSTLQLRSAMSCKLIICHHLLVYARSVLWGTGMNS